MSIVPPPHLTAPHNGIGTAAIVLGLLTALFSLIPIIGMIGRFPSCRNGSSSLAASQIAQNPRGHGVFRRLHPYV